MTRVLAPRGPAYCLWCLSCKSRTAATYCLWILVTVCARVCGVWCCVCVYSMNMFLRVFMYVMFVWLCVCVWVGGFVWAYIHSVTYVRAYMCVSFCACVSFILRVSAQIAIVTQKYDGMYAHNSHAWIYMKIIVCRKHTKITAHTSHQIRMHIYLYKYTLVHTPERDTPRDTHAHTKDIYTQDIHVQDSRIHNCIQSLI